MDIRSWSLVVSQGIYCLTVFMRQGDLSHSQETIYFSDEIVQEVLQKWIVRETWPEKRTLYPLHKRDE